MPREVELLEAFKERYGRLFLGGIRPPAHPWGVCHAANGRAKPVNYSGRPAEAIGTQAQA
jgi:hypothetical protein